MDTLFVVKEKIYDVAKHELRDATDRYLQRNYPERRSLLTKRLLKETLIYLRGYARAIDYFTSDPIIIEDMKKLLLAEGIEYIVLHTK